MGVDGPTAAARATPEPQLSALAEFLALLWGEKRLFRYSPFAGKPSSSSQHFSARSWLAAAWGAPNLLSDPQVGHFQS